MWPFGPIFRTLLHHQFGVFLLMVQIACSITIFSNMAFVSRQIFQYIHHPSGFADRQLFSVTLRPLNTYLSYADAQRDIRDLQALAGVKQVALSRWVPLASLSRHEFFATAEQQGAAMQSAETVEVSPQILSTLGLPLIAGRNFIAEDMRIKTATAQPPVQHVIITLALADALFGGEQHALGRLLYHNGFAREVIGVTQNWQGFTLPFNERAEKTVFYPSYNETDAEHRYLVRVTRVEDMAAVGEAVSQVLKRNHNGELLSWIDTIAETKTRANSQNWVMLNVYWLLLITLGFLITFAISGQTLLWITQRSKQIGIRRALGASRTAIVIHVLLENIMICTPSLLIGILLSLAVNEKVMRSTGTLPMSPAFLLGTCALLLGLCLASAGVPAWRASKISPSLASRSL